MCSVQQRGYVHVHSCVTNRVETSCFTLSAKALEKALWRHSRVAAADLAGLHGPKHTANGPACCSPLHDGKELQAEGGWSTGGLRPLLRCNMVLPLLHHVWHTCADQHV